MSSGSFSTIPEKAERFLTKMASKIPYNAKSEETILDYFQQVIEQLDVSEIKETIMSDLENYFDVFEKAFKLAHSITSTVQTQDNSPLCSKSKLQMLYLSPDIKKYLFKGYLGPFDLKVLLKYLQSILVSDNDKKKSLTMLFEFYSTNNSFCIQDFDLPSTLSLASHFGWMLTTYFQMQRFQSPSSSPAPSNCVSLWSCCWSYVSIVNLFLAPVDKPLPSFAPPIPSHFSQSLPASESSSLLFFLGYWYCTLLPPSSTSSFSSSSSSVSSFKKLLSSLLLSHSSSDEGSLHPPLLLSSPLLLPLLDSLDLCPSPSSPSSPPSPSSPLLTRTLLDLLRSSLKGEKGESETNPVRSLYTPLLFPVSDSSSSPEMRSERDQEMQERREIFGWEILHQISSSSSSSSSSSTNNSGKTTTTKEQNKKNKKAVQQREEMRGILYSLSRVYREGKEGWEGLEGEAREEVRRMRDQLRSRVRVGGMSLLSSSSSSSSSSFSFSSIVDEDREDGEGESEKEEEEGEGEGEMVSFVLDKGPGREGGRGEGEEGKDEEGIEIEFDESDFPVSSSSSLLPPAVTGDEEMEGEREGGDLGLTFSFPSSPLFPSSPSSSSVSEVQKAEGLLSRVKSTEKKKGKGLKKRHSLEFPPEEGKEGREEDELNVPSDFEFDTPTKSPPPTPSISLSQKKLKNKKK